MRQEAVDHQQRREHGQRRPAGDHQRAAVMPVGQHSPGQQPGEHPRAVGQRQHADGK